ncbi:hypothetical protein H257_18791 [Aphanomyces astaci]|uniref:Uncharacterized protein n=1 Tax=Aphanomyces astaci TaxID=112090 RepID=W4FBK5_APHAT|nr:hypothetical protein H257_18791 [Aphanomyces astaci]ETV64299.1 hypothetical protein H257_18791 [Aphanomyces astaci]|eukprot:XP_009846216.1 hypothetical protein H257_18791 [Aphanomyces astaci]
MPSVQPIARRHHRRYCVLQIRVFLRTQALLGPCASDCEFARTYNIPASTYLGTNNHGSRATFAGQGRIEQIPFAGNLVAFMEAVRDGEHFLTTAHLVPWIKSYNPQLLEEYTAAKPSNDRAYKSLIQWCLNFANWHGYSHRVKATQGELSALQDAFSFEFYSKLCLKGFTSASM